MTEVFITAETKEVRQSALFNVEWKISDFQVSSDSDLSDSPTLKLDCGGIDFLDSLELKLEKNPGEDQTLFKIRAVQPPGKEERLFLTLSTSGPIQISYEDGDLVTPAEVNELIRARGVRGLREDYDEIRLKLNLDLQAFILALKMELYTTGLETKTTSVLSSTGGRSFDLSQLGDDLGRVLKNGGTERGDFDFTFTFPEEKGEKLKLRAHKLLLRARSPYFSDMFNSGMKEAQVNEMEVVDISLKTMRVILEFIYTDKMGAEDFNQSAKELVYAADKFRMDGLLRVADALLTCTAENEHEMLFLAKMHGLKKAEKRIKEFIKASI